MSGTISEGVDALNARDFLTPRQFQTLQSAVNRIIPGDDYPCGWDAGVGDFFMHLFEREPRFLPVYQNGLDTLEEEAQKVAGTLFADLDTKQQDALLAQLEAGDAQVDWSQNPKDFFCLLNEQTLEGFYADPGNGGNADSIAWKMIGYWVTV